MSIAAHPLAPSEAAALFHQDKLGLPLAARIVHAHNGELRMESSKGVGTTVFVTFPAVPNIEETPWEARAS